MSDDRTRWHETADERPPRGVPILVYDTEEADTFPATFDGIRFDEQQANRLVALSTGYVARWRFP